MFLPGRVSTPGLEAKQDMDGLQKGIVYLRFMAVDIIKQGVYLIQ
jgi:hypothetical protein